jgi:hypothetical protein
MLYGKMQMKIAAWCLAYAVKKYNSIKTLYKNERRIYHVKCRNESS